jgi:hypothetical protein
MISVAFTARAHECWRRSNRKCCTEGGRCSIHGASLP